MAVEASLINQEFSDAKRERLGPLYPMYYEYDFYNSSSTWYKPEMFQYDWLGILRQGCQFPNSASMKDPAKAELVRELIEQLKHEEMLLTQFCKE